MNRISVLRQAIWANLTPFRIQQAHVRPAYCTLHLARQQSPSPPNRRNPPTTTRLTLQRRHNSDSAPPDTSTRAFDPLNNDPDPTPDPHTDADAADLPADRPTYEMRFTCRKCICRSAHRITKQAYHFGTVLITCPECKNRHLISDHLRIFGDKSITVEDMMREKGEFIRRGVLGQDGAVEFYEDGRETDDVERGARGEPQLRSTTCAKSAETRML
ncbi:hypothetical protein LTR53_007468 [Teratosphaeriaceae sp. CCFEE 6253]|nr:hypothetical protein LTR53_007468 [Teratosphaeriaceae sp. CCFEE 6253]